LDASLIDMRSLLIAHQRRSKMTKTNQSKDTRAIQPRHFNRAPGDKVPSFKAGSKRAGILTALHKGATYEDIAALCVKQDGTPWKDSVIKATCTHFWSSRGFGIVEKPKGKYKLSLPKGVKLSDVIK
jgi:hypothetical protein